MLKSNLSYDLNNNKIVEEKDIDIPFTFPKS